MRCLQARVWWVLRRVSDKQKMLNTCGVTLTSMLLTGLSQKLQERQFWGLLPAVLSRATIALWAPRSRQGEIFTLISPGWSRIKRHASAWLLRWIIVQGVAPERIWRCPAKAGRRGVLLAPHNGLSFRGLQSRGIPEGTFFAPLLVHRRTHYHSSWTVRFISNIHPHVLPWAQLHMTGKLAERVGSIYGAL